MKHIKLTVSKFETKIPANDDIVEIELRQITKLAEKMKWDHRFRHSYKGKMLPFILIYFGSESTYLVASVGNIDLGYVRITEKHDIKNPDEAFYSVSEIYVKPAYRNQRIAEKMIRLCVEKHHVQMMYIEWERVSANLNYFERLGFDSYVETEKDLGYLIHKCRSSKYAKFKGRISLMAA